MPPNSCRPIADTKGLPQASNPNMSLRLPSLFFFVTLVAASLALTTVYNIDVPTTPSFEHLAKHCAHTSPISRSEIESRQTLLARELYASNASAYISEPGPNSLFLANISRANWHLSERPLLLMISPVVTGNGKVRPQVTILTPAFEETRARLIPVVSAHPVRYAAWPEERSPYEVVLEDLSAPNDAKIFVDNAIRHFIVDGLAEARPDLTIQSSPVAVRHLRERKSPAELELLKCANEVTVLAIRDVRKNMYVGIRESQTRQLMRSALAAAGLTNGDSLVLFGENAALPHGTGTDRVLGETDFALIDCGGALHGYVSDVTRTFALSSSKIPHEHLAIFENVRKAQHVASRSAEEGAVTGEVDAAGRHVLNELGFGQYFTHRLGHGIGLEGHESPYLRGGNKEVIKSGHTFSNEPGIYIEGKVGVRLEDCFYIDSESGKSVYLTEGIGGAARSPWDL